MMAMGTPRSSSSMRMMRYTQGLRAYGLLSKLIRRVYVTSAADSNGCEGERVGDYPTSQRAKL